MAIQRMSTACSLDMLPRPKPKFQTSHPVQALALRSGCASLAQEANGTRHSATARKKNKTRGRKSLTFQQMSFLIICRKVVIHFPAARTRTPVAFRMVSLMANMKSTVRSRGKFLHTICREMRSRRDPITALRQLFKTESSLEGILSSAACWSSRRQSQRSCCLYPAIYTEGG